MTRAGSPERARPRDPRFRSGAPASQPPPPQVPAEIAGALGGANPELVWVKLGTEVWRYGDATTARYLKWSSAGSDADEAAAEAERLTWLGDALPVTADVRVPTPVASTFEGGDGWVVTEQVAGLQATDPVHVMTSPEGLAELVGKALRALHDALAIEGCPFDARVERLVSSAESRLGAGGLTADDLPAPFTGRDPAEAVAWLAEHAPDEPEDDVVVAHGDPSLPNFLIAGPDDPVGLVDLGRLGVSDRHRDLAIVVRSFVANFGPELAWRLTDAYGVPHPSAVRLEWYRIADDLV